MMPENQVISSWRIALTKVCGLFYWVLPRCPNRVFLPTCASRNSYRARRTSAAVRAPDPTRYTGSAELFPSERGQ